MSGRQKPNTILSVTAHPDDEVLGFGATAHKYSSQGVKIVNCILSGDVDARTNRPEIEQLHQDMNQAQTIIGCEKPILGSFPNIKFNTVPHLELVQFIESAISSVNPDWVFTHFPNDLNDDHFHTSKACLAARRLAQRKNQSGISAIFLMEIPSSTDWSFSYSGNVFTPNTYVEIGEKSLEKKLEALHAYRGVMRDYPHPRSNKAISALAASRGASTGLNHAEAFQCVQWLHT